MRISDWSSVVCSSDLISARQGSSLASLIHGSGYQWNLGDGTASIALNRTHMYSLPSGNIRVIGPTQGRLDELLKWWKGRLREMGYTRSDERRVRIEYVRTCKTRGATSHIKKKKEKRAT